MDPSEIIRLRELFHTKLHIKAESGSHIINEKAYEELVEGSYRWYLFLYSNLYIPSDDKIDLRDKVIFIKIFKKLREYHTICWSRLKLIPLRVNDLMNLYFDIMQRVYCTNSFFELRTCLYLLRCLRTKFYAVDECMIEYAPFIKRYIARY